MEFKVDKSDPKSSARTGRLITGHGAIETPIFMPVGTAGAVKAVSHFDLVREIKAQIILGNTYHLYLRPGMDIMKNAGGLHAFSNWELPILTDSGGYQVFSLSDNRKLKEEGVVFQSHIDGSRHTFTPEGVVDMQRILGSDIMMALDECTPFPVSHKDAEISMQLTHRWLERGVKRFRETESLYGFPQAFFPIVQGGTFADLRKQSAEVISGMEMEGNAIGGLSVGEPEEAMYQMLEVVDEILPREKPRYLMGVGTPVNILEAIGMGVDMFDCVMPTRNGRNGMLFTSEGIINIKNEKWKNDFSPIDPMGVTPFSTQYSKAYLRHLMNAGEYLGLQIASIHNLSFYLYLMEQARAKILAGTFTDWKGIMVSKLNNRL